MNNATPVQVQLKKLPFDDVISTLLKPTKLGAIGTARFQTQTFNIQLSQKQAKTIAQGLSANSKGGSDYKHQVHLRFTLLDTENEQPDCFPSSLYVTVNDKLQSLPPVLDSCNHNEEPRRTFKPLNVTECLKLTPNFSSVINVTWSVEYGNNYTISAYFVEKLNSLNLLDKLKEKPERDANITEEEIKRKLADTGDDIAMTSQKLTLAGPLCGRRIELPCRSSLCAHFQCFDAKYYLMMNERKQTWMCPICHNSAPFDTLILDAYFTEILASKKLPPDSNEINLHNDATWTPIQVKNVGNASSSSSVVNSITVDEDSGVEVEDTEVNSSNADVECVTIDSEDESDNEDAKSETSDKETKEEVALSSDDDILVDDGGTNDESDGELKWEEIENLAKQDPDFKKSQEEKKRKRDDDIVSDSEDDQDTKDNTTKKDSDKDSGWGDLPLE